MVYRAGAGLKSAGLGRARALHCRLGVWPGGLAQKPGPRRLGLLGYVVKAQAHPVLRTQRGHSSGLVVIPSLPFCYDLLQTRDSSTAPQEKFLSEG
jgi:hypothetical protein